MTKTTAYVGALPTDSAVPSIAQRTGWCVGTPRLPLPIGDGRVSRLRHPPPETCLRHTRYRLSSFPLRCAR